MSEENNEKIAEFNLTLEEFNKIRSILPAFYSIQPHIKKGRNFKTKKLYSENIPEKKNVRVRKIFNDNFEEKNSIPEKQPNRITRTVLNDLIKKGTKVINKIKKNRLSSPFHFPVDVVSLEIPDYNEIIKNPMDLSTIEKNLKNSNYKNHKEFDHDMRLIWNNAKLYNPEGNDIHTYADELLKEYTIIYNEEFLGQYIKEKKAPIEKKPKNTYKPLTYNEKKFLYQLINTLSMDDLYGIWEIISDGIDNIQEGQEVEIDIDKLSSKKARELEKYVKDHADYNKKPNANNKQDNSEKEDSNKNSDSNNEDANSNSNNSSFFKNFISDSN